MWEPCLDNTNIKLNYFLFKDTFFTWQHCCNVDVKIDIRIIKAPILNQYSIEMSTGIKHTSDRVGSADICFEL